MFAVRLDNIEFDLKGSAVGMLFYFVRDMHCYSALGKSHNEGKKPAEWRPMKGMGWDDGT
ncbi:MAG: hypothetical protein Kow0083_09520 [Methylophaga sp.]